MSRLPQNPQRFSHVQDHVRKFGNPIWGETPGGSVNGSNLIFTLKNVPIEDTLRLYHGTSAAALNRIANSEFVTGLDATTMKFTITFTVAPDTGFMMADYNARQT